MKAKIVVAAPQKSFPRQVSQLKELIHAKNLKPPKPTVVAESINQTNDRMRRQNEMLIKLAEPVRTTTVKVNHKLML